MILAVRNWPQIPATENTKWAMHAKMWAVSFLFHFIFTVPLHTIKKSVTARFY